MAEHKERVSELAEIMAEHGLTEAELRLGDLHVRFQRNPSATPPAVQSSAPAEPSSAQGEYVEPVEEPEVQKGTPVTSPMTGIFYAAPNPSSPPFVKEGAAITTGQVIGLIEAMKVFNEIPSPLSGNVLQVVAKSGDLVQPGDVLLYLA